MWCISFLYGSRSHTQGLHTGGLLSEAVGSSISDRPCPLFTSPPLKSTQRCSELRPLIYQRSTEHHHSPQRRGERERSLGRTRRQPISGLVSLQHLGGTEPSSGTCSPAARRKKTSSVRDAQLWFCEFDKKVGDHDTRWLKLHFRISLSSLLVLVHGRPACFHNIYILKKAYTNVLFLFHVTACSFLLSLSEDAL